MNLAINLMFQNWFEIRTFACRTHCKHLRLTPHWIAKYTTSKSLRDAVRLPSINWTSLREQGSFSNNKQPNLQAIFYVILLACICRLITSNKPGKS